MSAKKSAPKAAKGRPARAGKAAAGKPAAPPRHKSVNRARTEPAPRKSAVVSHRPAAPAPVAPAGKPAAARAAAAPSAPELRTRTPTAPAPRIQTTPIQRDAAATPRIAIPAPESDEGDGSDAGGLLAGPRNVQPYLIKRGEQYMNKEQLEHFQLILLGWKRDLMVEVDRTVSHMKDEAANFPDPNDRATQEEEFSLELRTRDRERKLIRKIDEALKRIEDGSYGYCLETGEEIGIKRLEARPVATLSIEAQERRERREKQYGDRDDRYR